MVDTHPDDDPPVLLGGVTDRARTLGRVGRTAVPPMGADNVNGHARDARAERLAELVGRRWGTIEPFAVVGVICILAGGMVAAVAHPTGFERGSWLAAYLVLVGGAVQILLGAARAWISASPPTRRRLTAELITWNASSALVIVGSLAGVPVVTTIGGVVLLVALGLLLGAVREPDPDVPSAAVWLYRAVIVVVLLSTPIGLAMAWVRHG